MWALAFALVTKDRVTAYKIYYMVRSFVTYHGILMAPGFDLGAQSIWKNQYIADPYDSDWEDDYEW